MPPRTMERFVDQIYSAAQAREKKTKGLSDLVARNVGTVVKKCGWKKRSQPRIDALQAALEDRGIYSFPDISDLSLDPSASVKFTRRPQAARPLAKIFGVEKGLQRFIHKYYAEVFRDVPGLKDLSLVGKEVKVLVGSSERRMDLFLHDRDGTGVVVELKRGDPGRGAPNQLRAYMRAVKRSHGPVRGVLITAKPQTETLESVIRADIASQIERYPIRWYWYSVEVDLQPA